MFIRFWTGSGRAASRWAAGGLAAGGRVAGGVAVPAQVDIFALLLALPFRHWLAFLLWNSVTLLTGNRAAILLEDVAAHPASDVFAFLPRGGVADRLGDIATILRCNSIDI